MSKKQNAVKKDVGQSENFAKGGKDAQKAPQANYGKDQVKSSYGKDADKFPSQGFSKQKDSSEYKQPQSGGQFNQNDEFSKRGSSGQGKEQYGQQGKDQYSQKGKEQYGQKDQFSSEGGKSNMFQVDEDRSSKKWLVHPMSRSGSGGAEFDPWCVECNSQNDANAFKKELVDGKVKPPTEGSNGYKSLRKQNNGKTTIYSRVA